MDADLDELLVLWQGGEDPGQERRTALLARLRADAAFRQTFLDEIRLLGMLKVVQAPEPRWLQLEDKLGWSRHEGTTPEFLVDRVMQSVRIRERRRRVKRALAVAAAILVVLGGIVFLRFSKRPETPSAAEVAGTPELAAVIAFEGVEWTNGCEPLKEGSVVRAGRLCFRSGQLTLAFFTGVTLTVEGPADLEVRSPERVFCHRGKLRARVPPEAEGFTILTSHCEVMDLGTEFGLNLEPDGKANLMVFEGEVALSVVDPTGRPVQSAVVGEPKAVEVNPDTADIQEVVMPADHFVRFPSVLAPVLELAPTYPTEILASKPWGYWRFERLEEQLVANEVAGRPPLRAKGGLYLESAPGGNRWVVFPLGDPQQSLLLEGEWPLPHTKDYAIEFWVQPALPSPKHPGHAALISVIARGDGPPEQHLSYLALTARSRHSLDEPCRLRFLDRWPAGLEGGNNIFSPRTFVPAVWHHIVAQKAGASLELYLDGQLAGTQPTDARQGDATAPYCLLVGQLKRWPLPKHNDQVRPFGGQFDELAVYGRSLPLEEIQRHFKRRVLPGKITP